MHVHVHGLHVHAHTMYVYAAKVPPTRASVLRTTCPPWCARAYSYASHYPSPVRLDHVHIVKVHIGRVHIGRIVIAVYVHAHTPHTSILQCMHPYSFSCAYRNHAPARISAYNGGSLRLHLRVQSKARPPIHVCVHPHKCARLHLRV